MRLALVFASAKSQSQRSIFVDSITRIEQSDSGCTACSLRVLQAMMVSLGRHAGTGHIGPVKLIGCLAFLPAKVKSKDMFTGK